MVSRLHVEALLSERSGSRPKQSRMDRRVVSEEPENDTQIYCLRVTNIERNLTATHPVLTTSPTL